MNKKQVLIIGGGPAGLTAAYELLENTDYQPIVFEADNQVGGISKTVYHRGNRMDIGGHRFFSKSDWVMDWWARVLPPKQEADQHDTITYQNKHRQLLDGETAVKDDDRVMLLRPRLSRIYFLKKFFDYPVRLNWNTIRNLGIFRMTRILFSYLKIRVFPVTEINNLEDFFISRFGRELYLTFFKDYTEKVWGVPCTEISPEWGAQRIKNLSVSEAIKHFFKQMLPVRRNGGIGQKDTNTSLIEQFLYPKYGPGQMWEEVASMVEARGGQVLLRHEVVALHLSGGNIRSVDVRDLETGNVSRFSGEYVISSMPVRELIRYMDGPVPQEVREVADGLVYRDFMTLGVLARKFRTSDYVKESSTNLLPDNWIYVQESDVQVGRLQIFNNWSPHLVADQNTVWLGMEYFCDEGDDLWDMSDADFTEMAIGELSHMVLVDRDDVLDTHLLRVKKAYPAYFGSYDRFDTIRDFVDEIDNLFLVGRNGMHRYNNQDHSMLTAKLAVDAIAAAQLDKDPIWSVNIDDDYHEERAA